MRLLYTHTQNDPHPWRTFPESTVIEMLERGDMKELDGANGTYLFRWTLKKDKPKFHRFKMDMPMHGSVRNWEPRARMRNY